jgi:sulfite exporter TauE/SafE
MNCYYHPTRVAVGVCKSCQRGLCMDCAAVVDDSIACIGRHEEQVRKLEQLLRRNILQSERISSVYSRSAIFYFLVGILFAGFGLYQIRFTGLQAIFFLFIGLFLLYAAFTNFLESRKFK